MTLAVMQAYFFPYLGYFQLIQRADHFVVYPYVTFRKRSWINRNYALLRGEMKPTALTLPVSAKSSHLMIGETLIQDQPPWRSRMLKTLVHGYRNAAHFDEVFSILESLINQEVTNLHEYNANIIITLARKLGITTPIDFAAPNFDLRTLVAGIRADHSKAKPSRVIALCRHYEADTYLNPIGGVELYNRADFTDANLHLEFLERRDSSLMGGEKHVGHSLSIIDPLMHFGFAGVAERLNDYGIL